MDKRRLFELYESVYQANSGCVNCNSCTSCEYEERSVVLLPFEEEFVSRKVGRRLMTRKLISGYKELRVLNQPGKHCPFFRNNRCAIHKFRPVGCRIHPFYPYIENGKTKGNLNLCIDTSCPMAEDLLNDECYVEEIVILHRRLIELIDDDFWKSWSTIPAELDNPKIDLERSEKIVLFLKRID